MSVCGNGVCLLVKVWLQGSALSPLLFVLVIQAISKEFQSGLPWELLYAGADHRQRN